MLYLFYAILISFFGIYSYALIDPNITFVQSPHWVTFRDAVVQFGYYQREFSWYFFLVLVVCLFLFHYIWVKKHPIVHPVKVALLVGGILLLSYPFLSHDFFNYMFDARIFTFYGKNPYMFKALDFPADHWTRFMHWTHRSYPYGPSFLLLSFIPSFLGFGKFSLTFVLFKLTNIILYVVSVFLLNKLNKKWAVIFATHPLIIIEGLMNGHNDMVGLAFAVIGVYFVLKRNHILGRIILLFSGGIKYINIPTIFIHKKKIILIGSFIFQLLLLGYLILKMEIQPWYFLALFAYLPFFEELLSQCGVFFFGLLVSYYPYVRLGGWDTLDKVNLKHTIILVFFFLNVLYVGISRITQSRLKK